jgi:predicted nucleic acid-binding protein
VSILIVDASVGIKWFLPEVGADLAKKLQHPHYELHTPSFFDVELTNILWKKIQRGELLRQEAEIVLAQLLRLPVIRHTDVSLLTTAFDLAERSRRTVYDCLYLALAIRLSGRIVTADERLINGLAATPWGAAVVSLRDLSSFGAPVEP